VPASHIVAVVPKLNVGKILGLTVTVKVVVVAHKPASGENVYTLEFWLSTTEGLQVPVIPFADVVGNEGTEPLSHIVKLVPILNVGVIFGLMVTVYVNGKAQSPAVGVNVYTPEFWSSIIEGLHVPVIPLTEVVGNAGTFPPAHTVKVVPKLNAGVIFGLTVSVYVVVTAHSPASGVNV
jgi:hypothetical protein